MKKITGIFVLVFAAYCVTAQHIQYRDKRKPVENKSGGDQDSPVPVPDNKVKTTTGVPPVTPVTAAEKKPAKDTVAKVATVQKPVLKDTITKAVAIQKIKPKDSVVKPVVAAVDTSSAAISKGKFTMNPRLKKPYVEEQNFCDLVSDPDKAPQLPVIINNVAPEMIAMLKARYKGRLYSITGLNMIDQRLKYKLKICDKDKGKFRSEYLDKDANIVNDPDLDYE